MFLLPSELNCKSVCSERILWSCKWNSVEERLASFISIVPEAFIRSWYTKSVPACLIRSLYTLKGKVVDVAIRFLSFRRYLICTSFPTAPGRRSATESTVICFVAVIIESGVINISEDLKSVPFMVTAPSARNPFWLIVMRLFRFPSPYSFNPFPGVSYSIPKAFPFINTNVSLISGTIWDTIVPLKA